MVKKKIFCAVLALMVLLSGCSSEAEKETAPGTTDKPSESSASEPTAKPTPEPLPLAEVIASGECGENVTWTLYAGGTLIISGTGPMEGIRYPGVLSIPWEDYWESTTDVVIEDGVTSIEEYAFYGNSNLISVTIGSDVTDIGYNAFGRCGNLTGVTIPDSVVSIGDDAFQLCDSLTSVTIGSGVTSIGSEAFFGCGSLTSVTIGSGVTSIGRQAFDGCGSLTDVYYAGSEARWNQIDIKGSNRSLLNATIHYNS